jgi:hypothetical protein
MSRTAVIVTALVLITAVSVAGAAADTVTCHGETATIVGTAGNDVLIGTPGRDVVVGFGGDDRIRTLGGDDLVCSGAGADLVMAGSGSDVVDGGAGSDVLLGEWGDDVLLGGSGDDQIAGGPGADTSHGGPGDDVIAGSDGDDELHGDTGADQITGGAGSDRLTGDDGNDILSAGPGDDELHGDLGDDTLEGGDGNDSLDTGWGDDEADGGPGNDTIVGWAGRDTLRGGAGDDVVAGADGDDWVIGDEGSDRLVGGSGYDVAEGGNGVDHCDAEATTTCEDEAVAPGDSGPAVLELQRALQAAALYRGPLDGSYGERTSAAVIGFHKVMRLPRTATWNASDWRLLADFRPEPPRSRPDEPNRVEVDLTRQVLYLIEDGRVAAIVPVSTGGGYLYERWDGAMVWAATPRGDFTFWRYQPGWTSTYLGSIYRAWSFTSAYAVHGSSYVPSVPVSHGCVRVNTWEADWLAGHFFIGMPVHVWD